MTIIYEPRHESITAEVHSIRDIIDITDSFNPYEQKQYKRFTFCNMNPNEEEIIRRYFQGELSREAGAPLKVIRKLPKVDFIFLAEIGHITLK